MNNILEIEGLSKSYDGKRNALNDCNFSLRKGEICAVVGESGSGKTTLLRLIAGLERPSNGCIKINGQLVSNDTQITAPQKRQIGMVFQDYALFPHMTVEQNIGFGLKEASNTKIDDLLSLIKMNSYSKAYPSELSGGQEQRVALARTLALKPNLLLLDEPFSNLDIGLKSELRKEIQSIVKELNTSLIFITHDLYDAIEIADKIIFLKDGAMLQNSPVNDFVNTENEGIKKMIFNLKLNANQLMDLIESKNQF